MKSRMIMLAASIAGLSLAGLGLTSVALADSLYAYTDTAGTHSYSDKAYSAFDKPIATSKRSKVDFEKLQGKWQTKTLNGTEAKLTIKAGGSFIFEEMSQDSHEGRYMCGTWEAKESFGKALMLKVTSLQERNEVGALNHTYPNSVEKMDVLSTKGNRVVVRLDGQTYAFSAI